MTDLVKTQAKQAVTTSLKVAEVFGKRHDNVLRDIENLLKDMREINLKDVLNFEGISYFDKYKRENKAYQMNKDGFTLLVMGYTGKEALRFKTTYIRAFNEMEARIREMQKNTLSKDETALVFQLINFFKYLDHCKKIEEEHKRTYIRQKSTTGRPFEVLIREFYQMRNHLLEIGSFKTLQQKYREYYLKHPHHQYNPNTSKFTLIFTMDKYEPLRHAIADFLKLELQPDGYTLKMASEAKDLAKRGRVQIEKSNETNLFREKEEDLMELGSLKTLAGSLLLIQ